MATIIGRKSEIWTSTGSSTPVVKGACDLKTGTIYHVTDTAKRLLDPMVTPLVYGNDVLVTTGYHMHGAAGEIHFDSAPSTPVTLSYSYYAPVEVTYCQDFSLNIERPVFDITSLGDTVRTFTDGGIIGWSGSFSRFYEGTTIWVDRVAAGSTMIAMKFYTDQPSSLVYVGYVHPTGWSLEVPLEVERESWDFTGDGELTYLTSEA